MITPLDIENKKFSKQMMNGYNVEEVDDFLDELAEDYGKSYKELTTMNAKLDELTNNLSHYKNIEATLQNTLLIAQTTAEEVKNVAKQQSDQIISEAQNQADTILREARSNARKSIEEINQELQTKEKSLEEIKKQFDIYKAKMESLLISQLELLKEINKDDE